MPMPQIVPHLWFDTQAKEAAAFYTAIFPDSQITNVTMLRDTPSGDSEVVSFTLSGQPFMAISAGPLFTFNESISFIVRCETQDEIDRYWAQLSADPAAEQCGWLKDKYGLSWQIVPTRMDEMLMSGTDEQRARDAGLPADEEAGPRGVRARIRGQLTPPGAHASRDRAGCGTLDRLLIALAGRAAHTSLAGTVAYCWIPTRTPEPPSQPPHRSLFLLGAVSGSGFSETRGCDRSRFAAALRSSVMG
jgi:predicted 3-demethylubiquinone-9 3-methyltransferase (glyoxalase superfamily)